MSVHRGVPGLGGAWSSWVPGLGSGSSGGVPGRGCLLRGDLLLGGCLVLGGLGPGGCLVETPRTATAAGGTHPTGMHSCLYNEVKLENVSFIKLMVNNCI